MPYNKSVQRILAGSLNYRSRPTEIPDNDAQKLDNFAFDEGGGLRSRKGHELVCTASGSVIQMITALGSRWQATGDAHIVGFKKYIWKRGGGKAEKNCSVIIGTGGMRKSNGTSDWRWIPEAPTTAPSIATADDVVTEVDDFTGGWEESHAVDGFIFNPDTQQWEDEDGNPVVFDPVEYDDHGLFVQGSDDKVFSFTKAVDLNLYDGFDKDDLFRIRLRAKKWSNVAGVSFDVDVGDGSFTVDYYKSRIPLKEILAGRKETVTFYLRKRPLEVDEATKNKNQWGVFERVGSTTDKDWRSVVALRVKVEFKKATRFWFSSWDMVGNEDNTLEGDDFGVYYTYTTDDEHESNPSPKSKLITVNHGSIDVTDLISSSDPQVTAMNIYLTGGTLGAVYRVNADPIPQAGSYTITQSANDLTDLNIQLEEDHDDPPDADGIAGPYFGRILAWKGTRYYWSHQNKPFAFSNPDGPDGDWDDIDESAGDIKYISVRPHEAWIYAENDMYVLQGDPADASANVQSSGMKMGTPSRNGVAQAGPADIVYLGTGIYITDGSGAPRKISGQIEPIFQGRLARLWDFTIADPVVDPSTVCLGYEDGIVRVSHSQGTLVYNISLNRWVSDSRLFTCFQGEGEARILGGQSSGKVLKLETSEDDAGAAIDLDYLSKAYDMGIQDNEKRVEDVTIYHDTAGQTLTVKVYWAEGIADSFTINSFGRDRTVCQLNSGDGRRGRNFAVGISGSVTQEIFIDAIDLNYYSETREGKSYDTAVSDAGTHKVKLIRELMVDLENAVDLTVDLETDVGSPNFALTNRETHTIGTNLFRRAEPVVMTNEVYAHDFRVKVHGTGLFHPWGARALVQEIGHYLHGEKGEYYLSDPVDWGTERVKLVREIEIVYRSLNTGLFTLSSDLPGDSMATRATVTVPQALTERTWKWKLSGIIKGRLFQCLLNPLVDFRLEGLRMRIKMIGEPHATAWTWVEFPLTPTTDGIWVPLAFPQDQVA